MTALDLTAAANFSACGLYRWSLTRRFGLFAAGAPLVSCGYNPSIATADVNDPTIRREISFAQAAGCGWLLKVNAFAGIATDPDALAQMADPVGELADEVIAAAVDLCRRDGGILLATWGVPKGRPATKRLAVERLEKVAAMGPWQALRVTKSGYPEHPLYLPATCRPQPWSDAA